MFGTGLRLRRLFPSERAGLFAVPLDHTVSMGPIEGLEATRPLAEELQSAGVDLLILPKGTVREVGPVIRPPTLLGIHLSASTSLSPSPDHKVLVGSVAEAVALGADLVSVQVNFGVPEEPEMLADLGRAVEQSRSLGLPVLCMTYVKRPGGGTAEELQHACRAVADLGADIVKTGWPGSIDAMRSLVRTTPVPVLLGGGERSGEADALVDRVRDSLDAGARGICIGRNLFQRPGVADLARRLSRVVHPPGGGRST